MSPLRSAASFVFFLVAGAGVSGVAACGSSSGGASSPDAASEAASDAAGDVVGNDSPAACPGERPSPTSPCTNGGQVGCYYPNQGGCGGATCTCHGSGSWTCFTGAGSCDASASEGGDDGGTGDGASSDADTCPAAPPPVGGSCSGGLSCSYCDGGALCDCNLGQWECGGALGCIEAHD